MISLQSQLELTVIAVGHHNGSKHLVNKINLIWFYSISVLTWDDAYPCH